MPKAKPYTAKDGTTTHRDKETDGMDTIVYGASDDLVEIEGSIREEFSALGGDGPKYLGLSNGVVLRIEYDSDGIWRVAPRAGHSRVEVVFARGEDAGADDDGCPGYSDKAVIREPVEWAVYGDHWAMSRANAPG